MGPLAARSGGGQRRQIPVGQVLIFLRWAAWLYRVVLRDRDYVTINLDESPVERCIARRRGWALQEERGARCPLHEGISTRESRSHVTLVSCISSLPELQPALPQMLIARDRGLNRREKEMLRAALRPVEWLPEQGGWVTAANIDLVLGRLRARVTEAIGPVELVLALDCATQRLGVAALRSMARHKFIVLLIPARQ